MISTRRAHFFILLATVIWGGTFPLIKNSLAYADPNWFVAIQVIIASCVLFPFVVRHLLATTKVIFFSGVVLGLLNGFGLYAEAIGLKTISSAESAFLSSTAVIIIPLLIPFFKLGKPHWLEILAVIICLCGMYILTGGNIQHLSSAEIWTLACALTTALSVLFLQKISKKIDNFALLAFYQAVFASVIPILSSVYHHEYHAVWSSGALWTGLLYCAVLATAVVFFIQNRYQQYTSPTKIGIIFTLEPVFASIFAFCFNSEMLKTQTIIGGLIILSSLILTEAKNFKLSSASQKVDSEQA